MNRKTIIAIGAFAVLSLIAFVTLRSPDKGERTGERPRPFAKLKAGDFDTVEVTKGGVTTVVHKDGDKYQVVSPVAYAADETTAKAAFEALEKIDFGDVVTEQKAKQAEFEVEDKGLRVVAKKGGASGTSLADMVIGKSMGAGTMVRATGKDEVWQASGLSKFTFDKNSADWRDKSITTFTAADAEKIEIKSRDGGTIALKKAAQGDKKAPGAGEDQWEIADSSVKIAKLDTGIAPGIVSVMSAWKTNDFADAAKPEDTGLGDPALTVTVSLKTGKTATVAVGKKKGDDDYYVKADGPQVFLVKKYNLERVNKRPIDFSDKTICDISDADLTEVAVTHGADSYTLAKSGTEWKVTKPKLDLDTSKVPSITGAFKAWKATGFAEDPAPTATGLVKPQAVIVAKSKSASCTVKIGAEGKDKQSYFAQSASGPNVFTVAKWAADRILVKVVDLKKATVAKK